MKMYNSAKRTSLFLKIDKPQIKIDNLFGN